MCVSRPSNTRALFETADRLGVEILYDVDTDVISAVASDEALRLGLVHQLADDDTVGIRCRELAARLEALPRRALERAKQCIGAAFGDPAAGYRMEANSLAELAGEADTLPRFAAFLDASRRRP